MAFITKICIDTQFAYTEIIKVTHPWKLLRSQNTLDDYSGTVSQMGKPEQGGTESLQRLETNGQGQTRSWISSHTIKQNVTYFTVNDNNFNKERERNP